MRFTTCFRDCPTTRSAKRIGGCARSWRAGLRTTSRPTGTLRRWSAAWREAPWRAAPPRSFRQHHAQLLVVGAGEHRAVELRWLLRRHVPEIMDGFASRLDRRVADLHRLHRGL